MRLSAPAALLGLVASALAVDLTLYLPPKPNPFTLAPSTRATLSTLHDYYSAPLSSVNTFVFRNVSAPGSYLVDVHSATDAFRPLRVDISPEGRVEAWETYRGNDWGNKGEALALREGSVGAGFELRALGGKNYFQERPKCEHHTWGGCGLDPADEKIRSLCFDYSEESHDPDGSGQYGHVCRHAEAHGEQ